MNCSICLFQIRRNKHITSCKHKFHKFCINNWYMQAGSNICPLCRQVDNNYSKLGRWIKKYDITNEIIYMLCLVILNIVIYYPTHDKLECLFCDTAIRFIFPMYTLAVGYLFYTQIQTTPIYFD